MTTYATAALAGRNAAHFSRRDQKLYAVVETDEGYVVMDRQDLRDEQPHDDKIIAFYGAGYDALNSEDWE